MRCSSTAADVSATTAPERVALGLSQITGGQAVFGSMTVADNLRMYGYSLGKDRAAIEAGMGEAYAVFPRLSDRRNQLASTLSGGEQQMLGLSKALMIAPRVLLIDEFSLGLAPVIVGQLMETVRRLNARGTAVLLVEQSVNVALSLVDRVYFMEKGRITYEGRAEALRADPELVAALSMGGAHVEGLVAREDEGQAHSGHPADPHVPEVQMGGVPGAAVLPTYELPTYGLPTNDHPAPEAAFPAVTPPPPVATPVAAPVAEHDPSPAPVEGAGGPAPLSDFEAYVAAPAVPAAQTYAPEPTPLEPDPVGAAEPTPLAPPLPSEADVRLPGQRDDLVTTPFTAMPLPPSAAPADVTSREAPA